MFLEVVRLKQWFRTFRGVRFKKGSGVFRGSGVVWQARCEDPTIFTRFGRGQGFREG